MGGNALKHTDIRRYEKEEYFKLFEEIKRMVPIKWRPTILQAFREKESFGDMDIMVLAEGVNGDFQKQLQEIFNPTDIVPNSNVISLDYKNLQIDFIVTPEKNFDAAYTFFAWNDLGNFIGKISHAVFNLKYGFEGLKFVYRSEDESRILGEITLSQDPKVILPFLGFDYERWERGFNTMEEIFDYVIDSEYFNPKYFQWEELSSLHKKRNKRRVMYHEFLTYIETQEFESYIRFENKDEYFGIIEETFPGFVEQLQTFEKLDKKRQYIKTRFNGDLVKEYYGLEGGELGKAIINFKNSFRNKEDMENFLYRTITERIWRMFEIANESEGNYLGRKYIGKNESY